jgi:AcrR family transcriptional regulator
MPSSVNPRAGRRTRSPRGQGETLREELIAAAAALLDETGDPDGVTVRGVTAAVGVAPTALYLHFADRADLLVAVIEERFAEFARTIDAADPGGDPLEGLLLRGEAYVTFALEHPGHYRALFFTGYRAAAERPELVARCHAASAPSFLALVDAVKRCQDAGRLRGGDPMPVAVGFWSLVHGYADLARGGRRWPFTTDIATTLRGFIGAFQPTAT